MAFWGIVAGIEGHLERAVAEVHHREAEGPDSVESTPPRRRRNRRARGECRGSTPGPEGNGDPDG